MTNYAEIAVDVLDILTEEGQAVTLRTVTQGAYDPATSSATDTTTDTTRRAVILPMGRNITSIRGNLVQQNDQIAYMDAIGTAPANGSQLIDANGMTYTVISTGSIAPTGTPVFYDLHIRA